MTDNYNIARLIPKAPFPGLNDLKTQVCRTIPPPEAGLVQGIGCRVPVLASPECGLRRFAVGLLSPGARPRPPSRS
ncbi:unnamed protein product [Bursaphelenchus xylophilus]|uniref:(pine wood nematode) hypothetical protein n=1 Tax=Bursaphelenchus xylophilus TaxID=6326 RepID=A0A1I7SSB0_BURXY|nr:unnamed protein product [Bursaphelenchus xylophilus]CAG9097793.1 unnamed protein product [Bursaphelenchus xylophilus]